MLRFAYSTLNWGESYDTQLMLAEIQQAGWQAVEIMTQPLNWLGPHTRFQAQLEQSHLQVAAFFGILQPPFTSEHLNHHMRRMDYAGELGAEAYGLVGSARLRWRPPSKEEYETLSQFCEKLAVYGAEKAITVAYHPHVACTIETQEEIDLLLSNTKHLKLCLDVSHIALVEEDPLKHLKIYWERLGYIHLKDWGKGKFVELGKGSLAIDFPTILNFLGEQGYAGWIVVEQSRSDVSPNHSATLNARYLTQLGYDLELRPQS